MFGITEAERKQYEELGFFIRERAFSATEVADLQEAAENVHKQVLDAAERDTAGPIDVIDNQKYQNVLGSTIKWEWSEHLRAVRSMEPAIHLDIRLEKMVDDPRLWKPAADIIGCRELSLFSDKLNVKRPGGAPFPWHQEGPYCQYGAEQLDKIVNVFAYLDDGRKDNGCLWVIPGSHRHGHLKGLEDRGSLGALYTDVDRVEGQPFAFEIPAGSVVWCHRNLIHGSQTNRSDSGRRVFVVAYQPSDLHRWRLGKKRDINPG